MDNTRTGHRRSQADFCPKFFYSTPQAEYCHIPVAEIHCAICIFAQEEGRGDGNLGHPQTNRDALLPTLFVRAQCWA